MPTQVFTEEYEVTAFGDRTLRANGSILSIRVLLVFVLYVIT